MPSLGWVWAYISKDKLGVDMPQASLAHEHPYYLGLACSLADQALLHIVIELELIRYAQLSYFFFGS